ncbi:hypothetical protein GmHk_13G036085 [Glycine max]|nr:hypothetical protein GmHk_13G036085 [Glycine max]
MLLIMLMDIFPDKYPLSVRNIKYGSRLYVNTDIAKIQQFRGSQSQSSQSNLVEKFLHNAQVVSIGEINSLKQDCYCLTVGTIDEIIIDTPWSYDNCPYCTTTFDPSKVGSACRSCQNRVNNTVPRYKLNVRMKHNGDKGNFLFWDATCIKMFGKTAAECRDELIAICSIRCNDRLNDTVVGDDIKVFPPCVDEILSKTWAIRFKYRSQLRQSSVLDVSEEPHHIQTLTTTLGLKGEASMGKAIAVEPERSPLIYHPTMGLTNPSLSQYADYDPGNIACLTPTKRISSQQTSSDFDSDEYTQYQLSTSKHIKAE